MQPPPFDFASLGVAMANDVAMDNLYLAILNEFVEEVTVERVLDYLCALNRPAFERASADNRIVIEAYKYVVQERKSHPGKSSRLKGVPELDLTPHAELYIPRERFDGFLSALFQFSILWEAYSLANIRIRNALVSKHEYEATFSRRHELFGLQFKNGLTRAMWDSEFDILDKDGSNRITFHELCIYFTTHVGLFILFMNMLSFITRGKRILGTLILTSIYYVTICILSLCR